MSTISASASTSTTKHKKDKKRDKKSFALVQDSNENVDSGKNEGAAISNNGWDYVPPSGFKVVSGGEGVDCGVFDWDNINDDDDLEVWVVRVPESVRPKHLDELVLSAPTSTTTDTKKVKVENLGSLKRKHTTYDIYTLPPPTSDDVNQKQEEEQVIIPGAEELTSLTYLLPRKSKKGRLYPGPKPIAKHLVITPQAPLPTPPPTTTTTSPISPTSAIFDLDEADGKQKKYKNPPRYQYPTELLTHRFKPYGSILPFTTTTTMSSETEIMDVDEDVDVEALEVTVTKTEKEKEKKSNKKKSSAPAPAPDSVEPLLTGKEKKRSKKRKGEEGVEEISVIAGKKSKKAKTSSS